MGLCRQGKPATPLRFSKVAVTACSWVCVIEGEDYESQSHRPSCSLPPFTPCADVQWSPLLTPCLFQHSPLVFFLSVLPVLYTICDMLCSKCIPSNISGLAKPSMTALPCAGHRVIQHCHACVTNIRQSKSNSCLLSSHLFTQ